MAKFWSPQLSNVFLVVLALTITVRCDANDEERKVSYFLFVNGYFPLGPYDAFDRQTIWFPNFEGSHCVYGSPSRRSIFASSHHVSMLQEVVDSR